VSLTVLIILAAVNNSRGFHVLAAWDVAGTYALRIDFGQE